MAIITQARMQQLRGKYNQLNKEALLPGEFAICDDHNPIVRTNTGYKEILTKDNAEYFEEKVADIDNAISSANEAVNNANQAINDMGTATTENTQKIDNAIAQLETDTQQKFTELDTQVTNTVNGAVSDLNEAKEQAIADMEQATNDNTQRVDNAIQQIATKVGIDDTQSSTLTTYSSDKIDKLIEAVGGGGLSIEIVERLPISGIKEKTLYLVPSATSETNNVYDEYIYIDGSWEIIGSTAVDLTNYLNTTGDASEVTVNFEEATERAKPTTGEKLKLMMGKIAKLFTDLKTIAFSGSYNDLSDKPTIPTLTNNLLATESGTALDAVQGKALSDKIGNTDISGIGDGSVTGAVSTLNSNLDKKPSFIDTSNVIKPTTITTGTAYTATQDCYLYITAYQTASVTDMRGCRVQINGVTLWGVLGDTNVGGASVIPLKKGQTATITKDGIAMMDSVYYGVYGIA